jgi:CRISPR-associated protein Cmr6
MKYYVPADTARTLGTNLEHCRNMRLILSRYLSEETVFNQNVPNERNQKWRDRWLKEVIARFSKKDKTLKDLVDAELGRWALLTEGANRFKLTNATRLVIGLGGKGALEFGITLHHVTGLPFIPGSALKGLARSYALLTLAEAEDVAMDAKSLKQFDEALSSPDAKHEQGSKHWHYRQAFGSQGASGICRFFDGVLAEIRSETLFTLDVMTPHFFSYYSSSGSNAPNDADNPNPVSYMTISAGNIFAFAVGLRHAADHEGNHDTLKQARKWLSAALQEMGVGSKTSSGYGYFVPEPK